MEYQNYINGEFVGSSDGQTFEQRDPANLQNVTGEWPRSTREDVKRAIEAAHEAFPGWADLGVYQRAEIMSKSGGRDERSHGGDRCRAQRGKWQDLGRSAHGGGLGDPRIRISDIARVVHVWRDRSLSAEGRVCLQRTAPGGRRVDHQSMELFLLTCRGGNARRH